MLIKTKTYTWYFTFSSILGSKNDLCKPHTTQPPSHSPCDLIAPAGHHTPKTAPRWGDQSTGVRSPRAQVEPGSAQAHVAQAGIAQAGGHLSACQQAGGRRPACQDGAATQVDI